jgi:hypothetical protein
MREIREHLDNGSLVVIFITLALFGTALVEKGFTHDMLLEAGVFLISVKLIMMAYKSGKQAAAVQSKLDRLLSIAEKSGERSQGTDRPADGPGTNNA